MGDNAKDNIIELGGREFKRVKNGLDEAQVASFINELISERDELAQSKDHIASLTRLAEKTITEADKMAEQLKTEATEQAKAESAAIIDKAKEEAQQVVEKQQAEAMEIANEKAKAIQLEAEKKVTLMLENERKRIYDELSNIANQQFGDLLEELESLKQQAATAQADFNTKLSQPREESGTTTVEIEEESGAPTMEESSATTMEKEESGEPTLEESGVLDESQEPVRTTDQTGKSFELLELLNTENQVESGKPQWEVEVLPPVDIAKIMEVLAYLDQLPQVENTEIIPRTDTPSIVVFLREPMNFVDVLRTVPEVAYLEEDTTDKDTANGEPRKVRISLSGNTTSKEKK